ncbi:uncharacterized protein VTP21DRAFT_5728 [Calcarisporiella thermophila]|uniref:uncharacterized protein n=1 Tax=Calcarisporiella thermophila TaxID=911321 RepID=UPI003743B5F9
MHTSRPVDPLLQSTLLINLAKSTDSNTSLCLLAESCRLIDNYGPCSNQSDPHQHQQWLFARARAHFELAGAYLRVGEVTQAESEARFTVEIADNFLKKRTRSQPKSPTSELDKKSDDEWRGFLREALDLLANTLKARGLDRLAELTLIRKEKV